MVSNGLEWDIEEIISGHGDVKSCRKACSKLRCAGRKLAFITMTSALEGGTRRRKIAWETGSLRAEKSELAKCKQHFKAFRKTSILYSTGQDKFYCLLYTTSYAAASPFHQATNPSINRTTVASATTVV